MIKLNSKLVLYTVYILLYIITTQIGSVHAADKVTLKSPKNTISDVDPLYTWTSIEGAEWYVFNIFEKSSAGYSEITANISPAADGVFAYYGSIFVPPSAANCEAASVCSVKFGHDLTDNISYKWKVTPGSRTNYIEMAKKSSQGEFTVDTAYADISRGPIPTSPIAPNDVIDNTTPTFTWNGVSGASYYILNICLDPTKSCSDYSNQVQQTFSSDICNLSNVCEASWDANQSPLEDGTYKWQVTSYTNTYTDSEFVYFRVGKIVTTGIPDFFENSNVYITYGSSTTQIKMIYPENPGEEVLIDAVSGQIIIIVKKTSTSEDLEILKGFLESINSEVIGQIPSLGVVQISIEKSEQTSSIISNLKNLSFVENAEPNYLLSLQEQELFQSLKLFPASSWINDIYAPTAWNISKGVKEVGIGIIDAPVNINNMQLRKNNQNNGLTKVQKRSLWNEEERGDAHHGTMVTSYAVAHGDDAKEDEFHSVNNMAGVCWNCSAVIYDLNSTRFTGVVEILHGINKIIEHNIAKVINISVAIKNQALYKNEEYNNIIVRQHMKAAIDPAVQKAYSKDTLLVFAAGNVPWVDDYYLTGGLRSSGHEEAWKKATVFVSGSMPSDRQSIHGEKGKIIRNFARGSIVELAAPGTYITFVPLGDTHELSGTGMGTSYSAPMVSGSAGLLLSVNSSLTPCQLKSILIDNAQENNGITDSLGPITQNDFNSIQKIKLLNIGAAINFINNKGNQSVHDYLNKESEYYRNVCSSTDDSPGTSSVCTRFYIDGLDAIDENTSQSYQATCDYSDGTSAEVPAKWTGSSSYASFSPPQESSVSVSVASVTGNQSFTLSASYLDQSANKTITIQDKPPVCTKLYIFGPVSIDENTNQSYRTECDLSDGSRSSVSSNWSENSNYASLSSSNGSPITVSAASVTGNQSFTLSASYLDQSANKTITIQNKPIVCTKLYILGPSSMDEGTTQSYRSECDFSDGSRASISATWSESSNDVSRSPSNGSSVTVSAGPVSENRGFALSATYEDQSVNKNITIQDVSLVCTRLYVLGQSAMDENTNQGYRSECDFSDGSRASVSATWSENSNYATRSPSQGSSVTVSAGSVSGNQIFALTASYQGQYADKIITIEDQPSTSFIQIIEAEYGARFSYCDVTNILQAQCDGKGACTQYVHNNTMCGDPIPDVEKSLIVQYKCGTGSTQGITVREYETISLTCE